MYQCDWSRLLERLTDDDRIMVQSLLAKEDDSLAESVDMDLLAYAPYADEASNREYRRANGIPERS